MKTRTNFLLTGLFLVITFFFFSSNGLLSEPDDDEITITGTVVEAEWDDKDSVTAVAISVEINQEVEEEEEEYEKEYEDYLVGDTEEGRKLLELVRQKVEATGIVESDEDDNKTIYVISYRILN